MTKIKLCGLSRICDIDAANALMPDYIGFVFWKKSRRYVPYDLAARLRGRLNPKIRAVGVFVDESENEIARLFESGIIDAAQLHGGEDDGYITRLKRLTDMPIIKAFLIKDKSDITRANESRADCVLLDNGLGAGSAFDWQLLKSAARPYFLAGGLNPENVQSAVRTLCPYAVDVSSGVETNGLKDREKMAAFVAAVRKERKI